MKQVMLMQEEMERMKNQIAMGGAEREGPCGSSERSVSPLFNLLSSVTNGKASIFQRPRTQTNHASNTALCQDFSDLSNIVSQPSQKTTQQAKQPQSTTMFKATSLISQAQNYFN